MDHLYLPEMTPEPTPDEYLAEINLLTGLRNSLEPASQTYTSDKEYYDNFIDGLQKGSSTAGPAHQPLYRDSPAKTSSETSSRKRSLGSLSGLDYSDAKRISVNPSPAVTPGTPLSVEFIPSPQTQAAGNYGEQQQDTLAVRPLQGSGWPGPLPGTEYIDLTSDDPADPFPELATAYMSGQRPQSVDAFTQNFMNPQDLAQFLTTPTAPGGGYGFNHIPAVAHRPSAPTPYADPAFDALQSYKQDIDDRLARDLFGDSDGDVMPMPDVNPESVDKLIANIGPDDEIPPHLREQTPRAMKSTLMEHQKIGLGWLKKTEQGNNKGGILADDMGLGKTVQALALILARPSQDHLRRTTLIVAPIALMKQWEKEIERHVLPAHRLKVYIYHGTGKKADFNKLRQYDCVLTTYGSLASELKQMETRQEARRVEQERLNPSYVRTARDRLSLIGSDCLWYRVILDEAQCIKNRNTLVSRASAELQAQYRLVMSGTPLQNNVDELYPLIRFLRIKPYNDWSRYSYDIGKAFRDTRGYGNMRERAVSRIQILLKSVMLRRAKTTLVDGLPICTIPPKHTNLQSVEFSDEESELYKAIETHSQLKFNKYLKRGTVNNNYASVLVLLLRLRQACCHPHLIKDLGIQASTDSIAEVDLLARARQLTEDVVKRLKEAEGFECPICLEADLNPTIIMPCGHTCCGECFQKLIDPAQAIRQGNEDGSSNATCPHCRGTLSSKMITDYRHFCKVFCPEKTATSDVTGSLGEEAVSDEQEDDSDETDDDDDSDSLDGFVVPDDVDEDDDFESIRRSGDDVKEKKKGASKKGKGKAPAKAKVTLAQLKKESQKSKSAKYKYLKRLRKNWTSSAKIEKTLQLLSEIYAKDPTEKVLIFSQFTSLLDILEVPLHERGVRYTRFDGSMKMEDRNDAVNKFVDQADERVMLISLKAGNAGLNLNVASQVILLDPFWNPFIEDQAVDRAHRMPQKREVHVHRLLVPETVEDRICSLQDKKREVINSALDENAGKSLSRLSLNDLKFLFFGTRTAQNGS
ncbi:SNF2 family N-terminal domain-containing protein [Massariosphaeria phaeospora]|uniref:SNF2 family N-terminal domain-containing protein n=1 Tax=Massariosphaeria phaeospora TaxID=100035 RepID=A0A7C8I0T7_9PLEO|nr:SNF2 family N-terminal domain-containing protein [Massariosphaeria phaeospora]